MPLADTQDTRARRGPWLAAALAVGLVAGAGTGGTLATKESQADSSATQEADVVGGDVSRPAVSGTARCRKMGRRPPYQHWTVRAAIDQLGRRAEVLEGSGGEVRAADAWGDVDPRLRPDAFEATMEELLESRGMEDGYIDCQAPPCFVALRGSPESEQIQGLREDALEAFGAGVRDHVGQNVFDDGSMTMITYLPDDVPLASVRRGFLERAAAVAMLFAADHRKLDPPQGGTP